MAALPSFVELMDSLGLSTDPVSSRPDSMPHSPSSSPSPKPRVEREKSPAIIISQYDLPNHSGESKRRASSGNIKAARFSPYSSTPRRGSMPALSDHQRDPEHSRASQSSSSHRTSAGNNAKTVPPVPSFPQRQRTRRGSLERLDVASSVCRCAPISSFARRHSPHSSPTSLSFAPPRARSASAELPSPVMLPSLPPMLAESFAAFAFPAPPSEGSGGVTRERRSRSPILSPMALDPDGKTFVKHHQAGLRISSFHRQISPIA